MREDCIFCKIANKELTTNFIHETDNIVVFADINPKAKTHLLVVPKEHMASLNELEDEKLMSDLILAVKDVTKKLNIIDYKVNINTGAKAGQEVFHLHIHVLAN